MIKDRQIDKWSVFILLLILLVGRAFLDDKHSKWIQLISFFGVIIALADLYGNAYRQNHKKDKFRIISGLAILLAVILMVILAGMILELIVFKSKGNDILTILALLISLPNDLYCSWINRYVNK